jgi:hypothetical protein
MSITTKIIVGVFAAIGVIAISINMAWCIIGAVKDRRAVKRGAIQGFDANMNTAERNLKVSAINLAITVVFMILRLFK